MANNLSSRRIFGGPIAQVAGRYDRALNNVADQAIAESLGVGTHRRVFPGSRGNANGTGSVFVSVISAAGATSTLKVYGSCMPNPDPADATHWSLLATPASLDLTVLGATITSTNMVYTWLKAEAVIVISAGTLFAYVRSPGVEE